MIAVLSFAKTSFLDFDILDHDIFLHLQLGLYLFFRVLSVGVKKCADGFQAKISLRALKHYGKKAQWLSIKTQMHGHLPSAPNQNYVLELTQIVFTFLGATFPSGTTGSPFRMHFPSKMNVTFQNFKARLGLPLHTSKPIRHGG